MRFPEYYEWYDITVKDSNKERAKAEKKATKIKGAR
jgi:hypothetical protein